MSAERLRPSYSDAAEPATLPPAVVGESNAAVVLADHAAEIRKLRGRAIADAIEIGKRLSEVKDLVGHDNFLPWLDREFGWDARTAQRLMQVYELATKHDTVSHLPLGISSLYRLAAPSTPPEAVTEVLGRAQAGEVLSVAKVKAVIDAAKPPPAMPIAKVRAAIDRLNGKRTLGQAEPTRVKPDDYQIFRANDLQEFLPIFQAWLFINDRLDDPKGDDRAVCVVERQDLMTLRALRTAATKPSSIRAALEQILRLQENE